MMPPQKVSSPPKLEKAILQTLKYFNVFEYPLTQDELHTYIGEKCLKKDLREALRRLERKGRVESDSQSALYALGGHGIHIPKRLNREVHTANKLKKTRVYTWILAQVPYIYMVGLSGSCAMGNARETDDVDLFIVSAPGRIWTSRITAIFIAKLLGLHRSRSTQNAQDKVCLNLFYDARHVSVPKRKHNEYVAHEVVHMKPLYSRGSMYEHFLASNEWISVYFPNIKVPSSQTLSSFRIPILSLIGDMVELLAKKLQKAIMMRPTNEIVSDTQLWFFPDDYEKKLRKKIDLRT